MEQALVFPHIQKFRVFGLNLAYPEWEDLRDAPPKSWIQPLGNILKTRINKVLGDGAQLVDCPRFHSQYYVQWARWCMSAVIALGKQQQQDQKFKATLGW